ncbi:MAG TPA: hypothetical protein VN380_25115 [Thermoanaerobaculia bacterium]|nr:hypothetical protein [Thermoanaerobaculia bacterium]
MLLALEYLALDRWREAIHVLVDIAEALEPGAWNDFYLSLLRLFDHPKLLRRLPSSERRRFRNSLGLVLSRAGEQTEATAAFSELRKTSEKAGDSWGIGQSLINGGVAALYGGELDRAHGLYEAAIAHARATADDILLCRSLTNLAQTITSSDLERAEMLLAEAEAVKERAGDVSGSVVLSLARGDLAMSGGDASAALAHYERAVAEAAAAGLRHMQMVATRCVGQANAGLGKYKEAFSSFAAARKLGREEEFTDQYIPLVEAEALARLQAKHYLRAEKLFREAADLHKERNNKTAALIARHDAGVAALLSGRPDAALPHLLTAGLAARDALEPWWEARCAVDASYAAMDTAERRRLLRNATRYALASRDPELQVEVAHAAAIAAFRDNDYEAADRELVRAMPLTAEPDFRTGLLVDRFYVAVEAGWPRRAENRFEEARTVAAARQQTSYMVDLHTAAGDWLWEQAGSKRTTASEAYAVALLEATKIDIETAIQVGSHHVRRLIFADPAERQALRASTRAWMEKQSEGGGLVDFVVWPFDAADEIGPTVASRRALSAECISSALATALEAAIASVQSPVAE